MSCKIIAHRGANKKAPQNTMPAFRQAIEDRADGFETDVHLSKDGVPVICHNYSVDMTSDGVGPISSYTLDELKKLDFGSYFSDDFKGTQLPTLDEFLDLAAASDAEIINIELKCPESGLRELVSKTLDAVKTHGVLGRVIISSFSPEVLKTVKLLEPACRTGFLYPTTNRKICRPVLLDPFFITSRIKADYIHPMNINVTRGVVALAHRLGMKVNVWTVNDRAEVKRLLRCGVDGIITDTPDKVREYTEQ